MKKGILALGLALSLCLAGCSALLERSYSVVEPYADRYWDASAEDTLRAENYQDLVNSLLLLVEQRSEEGVIRYYTDGSAYDMARQAADEVRRDTMLGSYLLEDVSFDYKAGEGYGILTYQLSYRQDAEDVDTLMVLSDSQSLVDLLRLAVREGHEKLTARFAYDMPREDVEAAAASLWQEICAGEDGEAPPETALPEEEPAPPEEAAVPEGEAQEAAEEGQSPGGGEEAPAEDQPLPPCPWEIRFYPDQEAAELVEVWLQP